MSSASSAVNYTSVYTNSEPGRVFWGADEELSDEGSPRVIVYGYDGLPMLPVAPPSPDYIPGPEEPHTPPAPQDEDEHEPMFIQPHDPDFVPKPIYPEYITLEDEHILPAEEQPLPPIVSPTAESPGYVAKSDPEEYEDDEIEDDDANDEDEDEEEEEENLASANSAVIIPIDDLVSLPEGTEPVIPPPSTDTATTGARITVDPAEAVPEIAPMTMREVNTRVTELAELHEHDTQDLYALLEDAQDSRTRISQRVTVDSQRVDLLIEDMIAHQETIQIIEDEAYAAREAWAHSIGLSQAVHFELQTHQEQASGTDDRDSPSDRRHETGDGQHAGRAASTARAAEESWTVKFATCALLDAALTWWNSQIRSLGPDAYSMTWEFVADETEKIDKYVNGLPDNIYESVKASKPKMLDETIKLANDLMDQKLCTYAERQSNNKRKADDSFRNNHGYQQQTHKKQNVARVYNMGTGEKKPYSRNLLKCTKCHFHHNGPCTQKCHKCNKVGHFACDCRSFGNANVANAQRNNGENPKGNGCFECGATGHFKRDCPKLKNKDMEKVNAPGWVYAVGNAEKRGNASRDPDSNVFTVHSS
nr:hypothetical protein [Tanacetum cinerariifolium]